PSAWDQALYAFLVEKGNRSGSKRTVESYSRMLWPHSREGIRVSPTHTRGLFTWPRTGLARRGS
ncbi:MAG TPA: hypothetical protein VF337_05455, partial [Candidatus Limnocylindrales bacterium]